MRDKSRFGNVGLLELSLVLAIAVLLFQLFPSLGAIGLRVIDPRFWPKSVWLYGNIVVVFIFIGLRIGPELWKDFRQRRLQLGIDRQRRQKQKMLKDKREMNERMREGSKRRLY
jgi:hypothetical protein